MNTFVEQNSPAVRGLSDGHGHDVVLSSDEQLSRSLEDIDSTARRAGRPLIAILCADIHDKESAMRASTARVAIAQTTVK
jgi:hypothetical protein